MSAALPTFPLAVQMGRTKRTYDDIISDTPSSGNGGGLGGDDHGDPRVEPRVRLRVMAAEAASQAEALGTSSRGARLQNWGGDAAARLRAAIQRLEPRRAREQLQALLPAEREQPQFCRYWLTHLRTHGTCCDAPRPGRPPKGLSGAELAAGVRAVVEACPATVAAMAHLPFFKGVQRRKGIGFAQALRRLRRYEPRLSKGVLVEFKQPLSPALMRQRVDTSKAWLGRAVVAEEPRRLRSRTSTHPLREPPPDPRPAPLLPKSPLQLDKRFLRRIIWVDAKKFWITTEAYRRWGLRGSRSIVLHDKRVRRAMCINYYSAVNYEHGGLLIRIVSGTKGPGYKPKREFKVCSRRGCNALAPAGPNVQPIQPPAR